MYRALLVIVAVVAIASLHVSALAAKNVEVGIDEQLGKQIPLGLTFYDSDGGELKLKDYIDKPTILSLVYYHCPGICTPLLTGLADVVDKVEMKPGKDFQVLTISFDPKETHQTAERWKKNHLASLKRKIDPKYWKFMTGDSSSIRQLTDACGFHYIPSADSDFIHAATLIVLTPGGNISRYLFGTSFLKFDLKMAIIEASEGKSSPTINKLLELCYSYDPEGNQYVFNVKKVLGAILFLGIASFFIVLVIKGRNKKIKANDGNNSENNNE